MGMTASISEIFTMSASFESTWNILCDDKADDVGRLVVIQIAVYYPSYNLRVLRIPSFVKSTIAIDIEI